MKGEDFIISQSQSPLLNEEDFFHLTFKISRTYPSFDLEKIREAVMICAQNSEKELLSEDFEQEVLMMLRFS